MSMRINPIAYEVQVRPLRKKAGQIDVLRTLMQSVCNSQDIVEQDGLEGVTLSVYTASRSAALYIKKTLVKFRLKNVAIKLKVLKGADWLTKWKSTFKPFMLTRRMEVIPLWLKGRYRPRRKGAIYLDTSLAFGTGLHPTTRFMVSLIERLQGQFESFLDIGTGTGILSIFALHQGAKACACLDISKDAVATARVNLTKNGYSHVKPVCCSIEKYKKKTQFDFVAANLITHDLISFHKQILPFVKPKKYLAVSGISIKNYPAFRRVFDRLPLRCLKIMKEEGWTAVLYQKQ